MSTYTLILNALIILLGVGGFSLSLYIFRCKHAKAPLVCPVNGSCDLVTASRYSRLAGIPVELLGLIYYAIITIFHGAVLVAPSIFMQTTALGLLALSILAFIFSLYLTGIQVFILKHFCTWCLISAALSSLIFLATYLAAPGVL